MKENKVNESQKSLEILKTKDTKKPLLQLRDYLTKVQQIKHDSINSPQDVKIFRQKKQINEPVEEQVKIISELIERESYSKGEGKHDGKEWIMKILATKNMRRDIVSEKNYQL